MAGIANATGVQFGTSQPYTENFMTNMMLDFVADARNNSTVARSLIQTRPTKAISGRFIIFPVRFGRNTGVNTIRPGGDMPDPGRQGGKTCSFETRTLFARLKIDGETLRRGQTDGGAFIEPVMLEMSGQADDIAVYETRMFHGDGSGRLAQVGSVATTTITLKLNIDIEGASSVTGDFMGLLNFEIGDRVAFTSPAGVVRTSTNGGFWVVANTATTIQVSLTEGGAAVDLSGALTASDWIVRASNESSAIANTSTGYRSEMMGFGGVFCDTNVLDGNGLSAVMQNGSTLSDAVVTTSDALAGFQGVSATVAANSWNRGIVLDNAGTARSLSRELMQQTLSDVERLNNGNVDMFLCPYKQYNDFVALEDPNKRYNDTTVIKSGHTEITFNGVPVYKDRFCLPGRMYALCLDQFTYYETQPLQSIAPLGMPQWERASGDKDSYWTGQVTSGNLAVNVRQRAGAVLCDLFAT